jgi:hypothetical protein
MTRLQPHTAVDPPPAAVEVSGDRSNAEIRSRLVTAILRGQLEIGDREMQYEDVLKETHKFQEKKVQKHRQVSETREQLVMATMPLPRVHPSVMDVTDQRILAYRRACAKQQLQLQGLTMHDDEADHLEDSMPMDPIAEETLMATPAASVISARAAAEAIQIRSEELLQMETKMKQEEQEDIERQIWKTMPLMDDINQIKDEMDEHARRTSQSLGHCNPRC